MPVYSSTTHILQLHVKKLFRSAADTVPQEQGMLPTTREVSAIKRAPKEACRPGNCTQPSICQLSTAVDPRLRPSAASLGRESFAASPSPPPPPHAPDGSHQTAYPAARPRSPSLECSAKYIRGSRMVTGCRAPIPSRIARNLLLPVQVVTVRTLPTLSDASSCPTQKTST